MKRNSNMNVFSKALLIILFILPIGVFAQTKVGHVNTSKIMEGMPEVKIATAKLDTLNKTYQAQMKELLDEYQKQLQALQDPSNKWTETIKNDKEKGLQQLGERIQAFKEDANTELQKKQEELMTPIRKKLNEAIQDVANAGKYTLVLDSSAQGIVLFSTDTDDLTGAVKKKLGL
jgi:outer membrane protein